MSVLCPQILHLYLSIRLLPQRVQHASAYPSSSVPHNKYHLLYFLMVSTHTNKSTKDNLKFHSQHSSTGSPTIVYFKLAQLSRRKGHNYADSQTHSRARSQAGSQACRCLGWQNHGVSEIGEASPSSSAKKKINFYPAILNCLVLFHHDPNKLYDPKISVLSEPTTKLFLRCTSMALFPYMVRKSTKGSHLDTPTYFIGSCEPSFLSS